MNENWEKLVDFNGNILTIPKNKSHFEASNLNMGVSDAAKSGRRSNQRGIGNANSGRQGVWGTAKSSRRSNQQELGAAESDRSNYWHGLRAVEPTSQGVWGTAKSGRRNSRRELGSAESGRRNSRRELGSAESGRRSNQQGVSTANSGRQGVLNTVESDRSNYWHGLRAVEPTSQGVWGTAESGRRNSRRELGSVEPTSQGVWGTAKSGRRNSRRELGTAESDSLSNQHGLRAVKPTSQGVWGTAESDSLSYQHGLRAVEPTSQGVWGTAESDSLSNQHGLRAVKPTSQGVWGTAESFTAKLNNNNNTKNNANASYFFFKKMDDFRDAIFRNYNIKIEGGETINLFDLIERTFNSNDYFLKKIKDKLNFKIFRCIVLNFVNPPRPIPPKNLLSYDYDEVNSYLQRFFYCIRHFFYFDLFKLAFCNLDDNPQKNIFKISILMILGNLHEIAFTNNLNTSKLFGENKKLLSLFHEAIFSSALNIPSSDFTSFTINLPACGDCITFFKNSNSFSLTELKLNTGNAVDALKKFRNLGIRNKNSSTNNSIQGFEAKAPNIQYCSSSVSAILFNDAKPRRKQLPGFGKNSIQNNSKVLTPSFKLLLSCFSYQSQNQTLQILDTKFKVSIDEKDLLLISDIMSSHISQLIFFLKKEHRFSIRLSTSEELSKLNDPDSIFQFLESSKNNNLISLLKKESIVGRFETNKFNLEQITGEVNLSNLHLTVEESPFGNFWCLSPEQQIGNMGSNNVNPLAKY